MTGHHSQADPLLRGPASLAPLGERENLVNRSNYRFSWKLISKRKCDLPSPGPAGPQSHCSSTRSSWAGQGQALSIYPSVGPGSSLSPRFHSLMDLGLRKRDTAAFQTVSYT